MSRLHAENLALAYDNRVIIAELHIAIPAGKITALVGPNGCGKSTLLRGLARLLPAKRGHVYLDGQAIQSKSTKQLAKQLGILPQSPSAPEGLTVRELVAQGRYPHQSWFQQWSKHDEAATVEALTTTNLLELADRPLDTLSGGQRQRAWIAMALAQETEILLLDEPTTYLDLAYQLEVLELLHKLNEAGRTIVMVLHDLNQACRYAHNLVAMRDGKIWAQGDPRRVMTEQMVTDVFGVHARIVADPITGTPMCIPLGRSRAAQPLPAAPALAPTLAPLAMAAA
jgi:iron complex transport system ATP-binding protein